MPEHTCEPKSLEECMRPFNDAADEAIQLLSNLMLLDPRDKNDRKQIKATRRRAWELAGRFGMSKPSRIDDSTDLLASVACMLKIRERLSAQMLTVPANSTVFILPRPLNWEQEPQPARHPPDANGAPPNRKVERF